ncbi:Glia-derived nexin [Frankliniella fusca]|uniref:Glia-derived nexin n=1 Tax=Frankliniella fusca TaxID=407009 RepID=A0AAE1HGC0_9NEOP|nr:Glia-derived nexin [Frankliniella fusca]
MFCEGRVQAVILAGVPGPRPPLRVCVITLGRVRARTRGSGRGAAEDPGGSTWGGGSGVAWWRVPSRSQRHSGAHGRKSKRDHHGAGVVLLRRDYRDPLRQSRVLGLRSPAWTASLPELAVPGENLVIAPFGVAVNLGMVLEGARGAAAVEIRAALGVNETQSETLRTGFRAVLARFQATADHEDVSGAFTEATLHSSRRLPDQYRTMLEDYYLASLSNELQPTEAGSPEGRGPNDLGQNETLVLSLSSDTGVMSHWRDFHLLPVYVLLSHQAAAPFTRPSGPKDVLTVPMVPLVGVFRFGRVAAREGQNAACWAVEVPLEARGTSLVLVLPLASAAPVSEAVAGLSPYVPLLVSKLVPTEMEVLLPQLAAVSQGKDLRPALRALGVRTALDPSMPQHVGSVTQDAFVSTSFVAINSVSSVGARLAERSRRRRRRRDATTTPAPPTPRLVLNRPFAFYVVHDSELVLLAGIVNSPAQVPGNVVNPR